MMRLRHRSTRSDTLCPYTTLFRYQAGAGTARHAVDHVAAAGCPAVEQVGRCPGTPADAAPVDAAAIAEVRTVAVDVDVVGRQVLLRSEEHTSELQSLMRISYAVFCLKKKTHYFNDYEYIIIL